MVDRDAATDSARMGEGGKPRGDYTPGFDCSPMTLEDEAMAGGWSRVNSPYPPRTDNTGRGSAMRGEPDMDSDLGEDPYPADGT